MSSVEGVEMGVLQRVRKHLEEARRQGRPFTLAWDTALRTVVLPIRDPADRRTWLNALDETSDAWMRAYEGWEEPVNVDALMQLEGSQ